MLQLSAAGKRFGPRLLFEELNWLITNRDRVGLVGANGSGKSTLLKVLAGMDSLDYGTLSTSRGLSMGYLPQDGLSLRGRSVFAECLSVFAPLKAMQQELIELNHKIPDLDPESEEYRQTSDRLHQIDTELHVKDAYSIESHVGAVLSGLGFNKEDWDRLTDEFSGGWQMRIALAKLLLEKPGLLLLDEPTNHLDLEARNWLESYLTNYPGAFVLISHDRYFLDTTVDKIVEIWNKRVHFYSGNYEKFLQQKEDRRAQLESAYRNQREKIEQLEAFINRFRAQATKAKQVQSRIKELDRIERIEVPPDEKTIHFSFPQPKPSGRIVAEFQRVSKSYGEKHVLKNINFVIERGDRIALVGINGAGKSTLIKLLSGAEPLTEGEYRLGHNAQPDYFAQDQYKELDADARMLDDLSITAPRSTTTELRSLLGCFLFSEDDVFKRIGVLSGGERNRYALARMLLHPSNFLLLDEPTNHLDMRAKDVLLNALQDFEGTVVFVSHDRYFIDKLANRVFEVADGEVRDFPGNYEDYQWRKAHPEGITPELAPVAVSTAVATNGAAAHSIDAAKQKRLNPMRVKKLKEQCGELERDIARLETEIAAFEEQLGQYVSAEETVRVSALLDRTRSTLESKMAEWEQVSQELETSA